MTEGFASAVAEVRKHRRIPRTWHISTGAAEGNPEMTRVFLVLDLRVNDLRDFLPHIEAIPAFIARRGGRHASRGADPIVVEGDWSPRRLVILEFPSRGRAEAFLADPDSQDQFARRHRSTTSRLVLVEGEP